MDMQVDFRKDTIVKSCNAISVRYGEAVKKYR